MLRRLVDRGDELSGSRRLLILHFNDVYDVSGGAAAKFATTLKTFESFSPLVLFSGDCYAPSLMSVITKGAQMPKVLNALGVQAACFGNHEFDWGVPRAQELCAQCAFPWLMSNAWVKATGETLGGGERTVLLEHNGIKVGLMGLIEREWLGTLSTIEESEIEWRDDVEVARELSADLRSKGAEVVIALTHMRLPNDERLMRQCCVSGCLDLILGGHDHDASIVTPPGASQPRLVKSGTDFRELSEVVVEVDTGEAKPVTVRGTPRPSGPAMQDSPRSGGATIAAAQIRSVRRVEICEETAADADMVELVRGFEALVDRKMDSVIGGTAVALDARFRTIRSRESNVSNFVADVLREGAGSDLALLNAGTLRADRLFEPGPFAMRDMVRLLPMADETIVLRICGADLLRALENGVSQYPRLDGRWPCVSQLRFAFDPRRPPGQRIVQGSVFVAAKGERASAAAAAEGEGGGADGDADGDTAATDGDAATTPPPGYVPLSLTAVYTLATKAYLAQGKDGYTALKRCDVAVEPEQAPLLPGLVRNHFVERAAAMGRRATGVLSPAKLAKARTVRASGPSKLAESARQQAQAAPTPSAALTPSAATPAAPTPLAATVMVNTPAERFVTPLQAGKLQAGKCMPGGASPVGSPGALASPEPSITSSRFPAAADALRGAICPVVEGRIICVSSPGNEDVELS